MVLKGYLIVKQRNSPEGSSENSGRVDNAFLSKRTIHHTSGIRITTSKKQQYSDYYNSPNFLYAS